MGYVRLLRRRRVLALWGAQALSVLGDRLYAMAVMWVAWQESGAAAMGLVAVAESLPYIVLGTMGRAAVARCASLRVLAVLDVVRALLVVLLPLAWAGWGVSGLLGAALLLGAAGALFDPNLGALVPDLVRPGEVQAVVQVEKAAAGAGTDAGFPATFRLYGAKTVDGARAFTGLEVTYEGSTPLGDSTEMYNLA